MTQCCSHDNDHDGNCRVHACPGLTRSYVHTVVLIAIKSIKETNPELTEWQIRQILIEGIK